MPGTPIDLHQLRVQVDTAEQLYGLLGPEVKKAFPMRWRLADTQTSSAERLSSTFLGRASGLDLSSHPTKEQQRDAILDKWGLEAERALPRNIPNRRPQLETFDGLRKIMIDLANKSFEVVSAQEKSLAQLRTVTSTNVPVAATPPAPAIHAPTSTSPRKPQPRAQNVTTTRVDPQALTAAEPSRSPRSTGPSRSTTGLETYVTGKFVSTNGNGEFSISIKPILRELEQRIADLAKRANNVREDSKIAMAARAYFDLLDLREQGKTEFRIPTKEEFIAKVDAKYTSIFNAEEISKLIIGMVNDVKAEGNERVGYQLRSREQINLLLDLAIHAETIASREGGSVKDELPSALVGSLYRDFHDGIIVSASDIARVMSKPHSRTFTDPSVQFEPGLRL